MHTRQTDILTEPQEKNLRWLVMQSLKHKKWILAVICGDFSEYYVTELMSENVELIIQYADYLNKGIIGSAIDQKRRKILDTLRETYSAQ